MLYMNLEVSSAFNFGLKPGAAFDSASVAHRLISPLVFWLRPPLVSATRDDGFLSPREQVDVAGLVWPFVAAVFRELLKLPAVSHR